MDIRQEKIIHYSNEILDYLLKFKELHPDFTFSLRQRDSVQSDVKRLEAGQWFQGSDYIYVPLFKKGDSARKIKTIGFTIELDKLGNITDSHIAISFKSGITDANEITFHKRLAAKIGLELNTNNHGSKKYDNPEDINNNLEYYLTEVRDYALALLEELGLKSQYIYSEKDFQKSLDRITEIKSNGLIQSHDTNYWIFQGSPKIYNAIDAINADAVKSWTVSAHRDKIKKGDKFILWLTGTNAGCYALGRVDSEVTQMKEEPVEMGYYITPEDSVEAYRVKIVIEHNLTDNPVLREMITEDAVFKDFNGGNKGTNFTATKEHYDTFLDFVNSNSSSAYAKVKKVLDPKKLQSFLTILRNYVQKHALQSTDERLSFNVWERDNRLVFLIGKRYALNIESKHKKTKISFVSKEILTEDYGSFRNKKGEVEAYWNSIEDIEDYKEAIEEGFNIELGRNNKCSYRKYTNQDFINDVYQIKQSAMANELPPTSFPLNQILYGPPGTGKTYNSINKAISIVNRDFNTKQDRNLVKEEYDRLEKEGKILFTTFHQSMSYEDFIEGIKPMPPIPNESINYEIQAGIFKIACARAAYLCYKKYNQAKGVIKSNYTFDDLYSAFIESIKPNIKTNQFPIYKTITGKEVEIYEVNSQDSIKARAKGSIATHVAPLTQENLEKLYNKYNSALEIKNLDEIRETVQVSPRSTEFYAVFGGLKEFEKNYKPDNAIVEEEVTVDTTEDTEKVKKFTAGIYNESINKFGKEAEPIVLIIDEINRGNVSQIFGELITLIEDDKRIGKSESLEVILPYSKSKFGVPPNLHLVGTMNTADRSVEALDTALRRRFCFEEMPPRYDLTGLEGKVYGYALKDILANINKRITRLLNNDHAIGHSYFLNKNEDTIIESFYLSIIPLLQEYFFGDYGKMMMVLGDGFVNYDEWKEDEKFFASYTDAKNDYDVKDLYSIKDYQKNKEGFKVAIEKLMNK
jgi:5-methylcytosine-specific restriction endonuclease McrBC GTP-binding regulatory subunit McrB